MSLRISINEIIDDILSDVSAHHPPMVVFDLDSTLFNVSPRTQLIVETFVRDPAMQRQFPAEVKFLQNFKIGMRDWGLREPLERSGFVATHPEFGKTLREYWKTHFFTSEFLHADRPYVGAVEGVHRLQKAGAIIYYLTGRDAQNMKVGTVESLRRYQLPLAPDAANLIMKPVKGSVEDEDFKEIEMKKLVAQHVGANSQPRSHVWLFDNEPVIIHRVRSATPQVRIIWVDTTHSGQADAPADLPILEWPSE